MTIELGMKIKDTITKFEGIAIGRVTWISGCDQISIRPESEGSALEDFASFDEFNLVQIGTKLAIKPQSPAPQYVQIGDKVKDCVTGFEGIVVGCVLWITGCWTMYIQSGKTDLLTGRMNELIGFDESRLEILKPQAVKLPSRDKNQAPKIPVNPNTNGGPTPRH